jgi:hypothetical protein
MTVEGDVQRADRAHRNTYHFFTGLMKYGAIVAVITAFIVILIIRS